MPVLYLYLGHSRFIVQPRGFGVNPLLPTQNVEQYCATLFYNHKPVSDSFVGGKLLRSQLRMVKGVDTGHEHFWRDLNSNPRTVSQETGILAAAGRWAKPIHFFIVWGYFTFFSLNFILKWNSTFGNKFIEIKTIKDTPLNINYRI